MEKEIARHEAECAQERAGEVDTAVSFEKAGISANSSAKLMPLTCLSLSKARFIESKGKLSNLSAGAGRFQKSYVTVKNSTIRSCCLLSSDLRRQRGNSGHLPAAKMEMLSKAPSCQTHGQHE